MKKYFKEIIILLIQVFMFYIFPCFCGPTDAMGMVLIIFISTFVLGFVLSIISKFKIKYLYPIVISLLFIPSVFIYYNSSALIHSIWYFCNSLFGIVVGYFINKVIK